MKNLPIFKNRDTVRLFVAVANGQLNRKVFKQPRAAQGRGSWVPALAYPVATLKAKALGVVSSGRTKAPAMLINESGRSCLVSYMPTRNK